MHEVPEEDSSSEEEYEDEVEQSPEGDSSPEQLQGTKNVEALKTLLMQSPYASIEMSSRQ